MKRMIGIGTVLLFLLGANAAFTQEPESEKEKKKPQQEETKKPEKPAEKDAPPRSEPAKSESAKPTPPKPSRQEPPPEKAKPKPNEKTKPQEEGERERSNTGAQASEKTRHGGRRIPDPQFRRSFGREHTVRVERGERRFQSNGFVFEVVEVWPADWIFDDECYIDYIDDDYYLVDVIHPEHRIVVIVVEG
jgi:type IV secretory pathway VirB10-like protein